MFYPLQLAVLKSEGGDLAEGNMQVGGEHSQKQIILPFDTESLVCKLLFQTNKRSFVEGKWNISIMSSCEASVPTCSGGITEMSIVPRDRLANFYLH